MLEWWGVLCVILGELLSVIPYGISGLGRAHELGWPAGGGRGHRIRIILCRINSNTGSPGPAVHVSAGRAAEAGDTVFELICAKYGISGPDLAPGIGRPAGGCRGPRI